MSNIRSSASVSSEHLT